MLVVQYNCGQGYESTVMALETALSIRAGIVMVQEPFISNRRFLTADLTFTCRKEKRIILE